MEVSTEQAQTRLKDDFSNSKERRYTQIHKKQKKKNQKVQEKSDLTSILGSKTLRDDQHMF